jgi:hypothetical protein
MSADLLTWLTLPAFLLLEFFVGGKWLSLLFLAFAFLQIWAGFSTIRRRRSSIMGWIALVVGVGILIAAVYMLFLFSRPVHLSI